MGFEIKFNWALQINSQENLVSGKLYDFYKEKNRIFPIGIPIDMISPNREAVAKIRIIEFKNTKGKTTGKYEVIKIYEGTEKQVLSNYWKENI